MGITIRRAAIAALGMAALAPAAAPAADGVLGPAFPANVRAHAAVAPDGSTRVAWFTGKPGLGTEGVSTCAIPPGRNLCSVPAKTITFTSTQVSRVGVGPVPFLPGGNTVLLAFNLQVDTGPSVALSRSDDGGNTFSSRFIGLGGGGPLAYGPGDAISTVYNDFNAGDSRDFTYERMPTDGSELNPDGTFNTTPPGLHRSSPAPSGTSTQVDSIVVAGGRPVFSYSDIGGSAAPDTVGVMGWTGSGSVLDPSTWSPNATIGNGTTSSLAVVPGGLEAAWVGKPRSADGRLAVYAKRIGAAGSPVLIGANEIAEPSAPNQLDRQHAQQLSALAAGPDGRLYLAWIRDRLINRGSRFIPAYRVIELRLGASTNGGASWARRTIACTTGYEALGFPSLAPAAGGRGLAVFDYHASDRSLYGVDEIHTATLNGTADCGPERETRTFRGTHLTLLSTHGGTHPAGCLPRFGDTGAWVRASGGPYRIQRASFRVDSRRAVTVSHAPFAPFESPRTNFPPGSMHKLKVKVTLRRRGGGTATVELARSFQVCTVPR